MFRELDGPDAPDDLSSYAVRLSKKKFCSFLGSPLSENDPIMESKI